MAAIPLKDATLLNTEHLVEQALVTPLRSQQQSKDITYDQLEEGFPNTQKHECSRGWAGVCPEKEPGAVLVILVGGALAFVASLWALAACSGFCCACGCFCWERVLITDSCLPSAMTQRHWGGRY